MKRQQKYGLAAIAVAAIFVIGLYSLNNRYFRPCTLLIKADGDWDVISISSTNYSGKRTFTPSDSSVELASISHGEYVVAVHFRDGKTAWITFFQYDAGRRKRNEIDIRRYSAGDKFSLIQRVSDCWGKQEKVFDGDAVISEMTEEKPFVLDWI